jgi:hypothetical protein
METIEKNLDQLRYPVGKFSVPTSYSSVEIKQWIQILEELPSKLRKEISGLSDEQLDTPYRDGGWTIRQVVHHFADSHVNSYCRMKLTLTEDNPTIRPYFEDRWAEMHDGKTAPVEISLQILDGLHKRMVMMLNHVSEEDFERTYFHPETQKTNPLKALIALYAWHSRHHLAHITELKKRKGWGD